MQRLRKKRDYKRVFIGIISSILLTLIITIGIILLLNLFTLKTIIIQTPDKRIEGLENIKRANIFFLNSGDIQENLLKKNPWIESINIQKSHPDRLFLDIKAKKIVASIESFSNVYLVTKDAVIVDEIDKAVIKGLPHIVIDGLIVKRGDKLPANIQNLIQYLSNKDYAARKNQEKSYIDLKSQIATIVLKDGTNIIVPLHKIDPGFPTSLQTIIERFRIEGKKLSTVDFRFEKPIITFQ